jgi:hypothetical protein
VAAVRVPLFILSLNSLAILWFDLDKFTFACYPE